MEAQQIIGLEEDLKRVMAERNKLCKKRDRLNKRIDKLLAQERGLYSEIMRAEGVKKKVSK
jgi:seryl-tRNA synthetase